MTKPYRAWEVTGGQNLGESCYVMERNPKKGRLGGECYLFATKDAAEAYAARRISEDLEREKLKAERRAAKAAQRKATPNPFKVGMLFINSWGYEQTNVDYFQVVRLTPRGVYLRPIGSKSCVNSTVSHGMADTVVPDKDNFTGPEIFKPILPGSEKGYLSAEFGCMKLCNEEDSHYRSWYA